MTKIKFHFLDVGDGDCTLIEFPSGRIGLIDIHTNHEYGNKTIEYIKKILNGKSIFRFILTHPHQDHLHGIKDLIDSGINIENLWHIPHDFEPDKTQDSWKNYEKHWEYYKKRNNNLFFSLENHKCDFLIQDNIKILSPSLELNKQAENLGEDNCGVHRNNYVLKISHGKFSALFCGDSDIPLLNHLKENHSFEVRDVTLLKAPHHGTETHCDEDFIKLCNPTITIFHQGKERAENSAKSKYSKYSGTIGITKSHGVIVVEGNENGRNNILTNGGYDKVLIDLGNETKTN